MPQEVLERLNPAPGLPSSHRGQCSVQQGLEGVLRSRRATDYDFVVPQALRSRFARSHLRPVPYRIG